MIRQGRPFFDRRASPNRSANSIKKSIIIATPRPRRSVLNGITLPVSARRSNPRTESFRRTKSVTTSVYGARIETRSPGPGGWRSRVAPCMRARIELPTRGTGWSHRARRPPSVRHCSDPGQSGGAAAPVPFSVACSRVWSCFGYGPTCRGAAAPGQSLRIVTRRRFNARVADRRPRDPVGGRGPVRTARQPRRPPDPHLRCGYQPQLVDSLQGTVILLEAQCLQVPPCCHHRRRS